jgi:acyl carrier protein
LHGREKELINRGGEKISPLEIDQALLLHPAVAQAAACAVPHPRLGEDVAAGVVLQAGASATPEELRDYLVRHLAVFKVPRRVVILNELPTGLSGKVQRSRLSKIITERSDQPLSSESRLHDDLLRLWTRMLKTDQISLDDDFFEKGGDSLLAMDFSAELSRMLGKTVPEDILFEHSTIRELAKRLATFSSGNI